MLKAILTTAKPDPNILPHHQQVHLGYVCEIDTDGNLVAEIPAELVDIEIAAGRARLVE